MGGFGLDSSGSR